MIEHRREHRPDRRPERRPDRGRTDPDRPLPTPKFTRGKDEPHYTTWLLLRYQAGDTGNRPIPPGAVFWESPDVWTQGSQGTNQPVAGEPTQVFARVTNYGMQDATGVTIRYYWADPSVAIAEDPSKLIGQITNAAIPSQNSLVFQCPNAWVPVNVNNGHECLFVEAYIPVLDGLTDPAHPVNDRHVGQKNEQLVTLQQGQSFKFLLKAHNFTAAEREIVVEARAGLIPRNFTQRFGTPRRWTTALVDAARPLPLKLHIDAKPTGKAKSSKSATERLAAAARALDIGCLAPAQTGAKLVFKPGEIHQVTVAGALPPSAQAGEVYATRIVQRIGNVIVGGYTFYVTLAAGKG